MKTQQPVWTAEKLQAVSAQLESEISALSPADQLAWCLSTLAVLAPAMSQLRGGVSRQLATLTCELATWC